MGWLPTDPKELKKLFPTDGSRTVYIAIYVVIGGGLAIWLLTHL